MIRGRFAPSPTGRMHLGNVFAAMIAWLSVRSQGGELVLRMEDIDTQRSRPEYARLLREDLRWLGLDWDLESQPQSLRSRIYEEYLRQLRQKQLVYPCWCTRAQLHSLGAPHASDGTYVYPGTCRDLPGPSSDRPPAWRLRVPDRVYRFRDRLQGEYAQNLAAECGDFVLRRGDGMYVYQLAVTVDDGLSGVTEVVRGMDLLSSTPRQLYLQELLGFPRPQYGHVPLLLSSDGRRLSKRDRDMDLGYLRSRADAEALLGALAHAAGLLARPERISARELIGEFSWERLKKDPIYLKTEELF